MARRRKEKHELLQCDLPPPHLEMRGGEAGEAGEEEQRRK
jgi:hypothetical protein